MPNYRNGRAAKVGDHVVGRTYNTDGIVAATLVAITPLAEYCNCEVEFIAVAPVTVEPPPLGGISCIRPRMAMQGASRLERTENHGMAGPHAMRFTCRDYGEIKAFLHVDDLAALALAMPAVAPDAVEQ